MAKYIEGLIVKIIFGILLIFLILQHHYVFMYFDDYGHASLSYGHVVADVKGHNFNLKDEIEWIKWYYFEWGGRAVYYFLFLLPLLSKSISLFMFVQSIILFFVFVYLFKIIQSFNNNFNPILTILSLITLYGLIPIDYLKESVYWASASVCYIWSLLPLLMGIFYFMQATQVNSVFKIRQIVMISVLFFFAASSFEQSGAAALVFVIFYVIFLFCKTRSLHLKLSIPAFLFSLSGVLFQYFSPGNNARLKITNANFVSLSLFGKVRNGLPGVLIFIFDHRISIFIFILCLLSIAIAALINKKKYKYSYLIVLPIIFPVYFILKAYFNLGASTLFELVLLIGIFSYFVLFMFHKGEFIPILLAVAASIFCLVLSPVLQPRSAVFFLLLLFIPIVIILNSIFVVVNRNNKILFLMIFVIFVAVSLNNYKNTFLGYKENYSYAIADHNKLLSVSNKQKSNSKIILYKYPNDMYRGNMPYDAATPYIKVWMLQYYNLPKNTQIEWKDPKKEHR